MSVVEPHGSTDIEPNEAPDHAADRDEADSFYVRLGPGRFRPTLRTEGAWQPGEQHRYVGLVDTANGIAVRRPPSDVDVSQCRPVHPSVPQPGLGVGRLRHHGDLRCRRGRSDQHHPARPARAGGPAEQILTVRPLGRS